MPVRRPSSETSQRPRKPATTPEARENQLIVRAERLAERQLEDGTASAQVITHYLKLGSTRERLEQTRIAGEVELQKAKIEAMASHQRMEVLYAEAINAMRAYSGHGPVESEDPDDV